MEKIIYSNWLAAALIKRGFNFIRTEPNPRYPQYFCWVFEATDDFIAAFGELSQARG